MSDEAEKKSRLPPGPADAKQSERSISLVRTLVCLSLLVAAVVCGVVSYLVLRASEHKNYRNQYNAATKQMKRSVEASRPSITRRRTSLQYSRTCTTPTPRGDPSWPSRLLSHRREHYQCDRVCVGERHPTDRSH